MKIKGFCLGQFLTSSLNCCESGKSHFVSHSPLLSLTIFRYLCTTSAAKLGLGNIRGLDDALCLYESMARMRPLPCVKQFNQLLSRVVNLKEYSAAIRLFKDICNLGISVNECTMNIAINSYCLSNRVDYGFSILVWFYKRGCVLDDITFNTLLKGLFRENRINEAQELFRKILREGMCELSVVTYGTVIDGLCKAGNTAMAIELFRVMEKGSCKPNSHIYSTVIDGLCKDGMIDSAVKLFAEMTEKGITPNVVTYTALICGFCNLGRWREVKLLLKEMMHCKIHPNVMTFNTLIDAFCKEGLMDEAEDVLHLMMERNVVPDVVSYSALMDGYCLQGRMTEARNVFDSMASKNIVPSINSFNILINGYCKKMKINDAIHLFHEMRLKGLMPDIVTYTTLLHGLFRVGRCSSALKLFDELQAARLKPNFHTYCNLLDGLCKNGNVEQALLLLDALEHEGEHLHIGSPSNGLEPSVVTYTILIKGCYQNGLLEEAKDLFLKMEQASLSPEGATYNVVVQGNLRSGKYDDASKFFEEMCAKGFAPDASTFALLLDLLGTVEHNPTIFKMIQKFAPNDIAEDILRVCRARKLFFFLSEVIFPHLNERDRLFKLMKEDQTFCESAEEIERIISGFFLYHFTSEGTSHDFQMLEGIPNSISRDINRELMIPVDEAEIKHALFDLSPDKAPKWMVRLLFFPALLDAPACGNEVHKCQIRDSSIASTQEERANATIC
ncbi:hypothetical protein DH2020_026574 [Rehmannia glutinosa]|uniref:Pentatricopeptide repeat-containing protein n=1 Tax=Rehmannia glutinosa TaxID=99300 RepID=A0ABR0VWI4_REHGL